MAQKLILVNCAPLIKKGDSYSFSEIKEVNDLIENGWIVKSVTIAQSHESVYFSALITIETV